MPAQLSFTDIRALPVIVHPCHVEAERNYTFPEDHHYLMQGFLEVWGEGATWQELCESVRARLSQQDRAYFNSDVSWKVNIDGWGCTVDDPLRRLKELAFIGFQVRAIQNLSC